MGVAALSDIHGNLPALEAVLAEVEQESVHASTGSIREGAAPGSEEQAGWLLEPPDPDEATAYFEGQRAT